MRAIRKEYSCSTWKDVIAGGQAVRRSIVNAFKLGLNVESNVSVRDARI